MKARKPNETAEDYIARLEAANASLRQENARLKKFQGYCVDVLRVAASRVGLLFDYAADLCGMADSPEHAKIREEVARLCELPWEREPGPLDFPAQVKWVLRNPDPPSDAGMILRSALEQAKAARDPWKSNAAVYPDALPPIETWDWQGVWYEVCDALSDLEFSRLFLRDDLRSAMFDHCMMRVARAVRHGAELQEGRPAIEDSPIPF